MEQRLITTKTTRRAVSPLKYPDSLNPRNRSHWFMFNLSTKVKVKVKVKITARTLALTDIKTLCRGIPLDGCGLLPRGYRPRNNRSFHKTTNRLLKNTGKTKRNKVVLPSNTVSGDNRPLHLPRITNLGGDMEATDISHPTSIHRFAIR
jgi:hypothetical protein